MNMIQDLTEAAQTALTKGAPGAKIREIPGSLEISFFVEPKSAPYFDCSFTCSLNFGRETFEVTIQGFFNPIVIKYSDGKAIRSVFRQLTERCQRAQLLDSLISPADKV